MEVRNLYLVKYFGQIIIFLIPIKSHIQMHTLKLYLIIRRPRIIRNNNNNNNYYYYIIHVIILPIGPGNLFPSLLMPFHAHFKIGHQFESCVEGQLKSMVKRWIL